MSDVRTLPVGEGNEEVALALDELAREGARRMIAVALRAEADAYVERFDDELDEDGRRLVVRNGRARERRVTVGSGTIPLRAPRVNDKRGVGPSEVAREAPLWCVRAALPARGCRGGPPALAGARSRDDVRVSGG